MVTVINKVWGYHRGMATTPLFLIDESEIYANEWLSDFCVRSLVLGGPTRIRLQGLSIKEIDGTDVMSGDTIIPRAYQFRHPEGRADGIGGERVAGIGV
jgi:hypothetical protein